MKGYRDIAGDGGSNIVEQVVAQQGRLAARMASVRATVAVVSGKGGVGKSSITANLAGALAARGLRVGVLDADLNGPSMGKMLGVRGQTLRVAPDGVQPAVSAEGIRVLSMDLLLPGDDTPVVWEAPTQAESHTWRGTMEGTALREFPDRHGVGGARRPPDRSPAGLGPAPDAARSPPRPDGRRGGPPSRPRSLTWSCGAP
jgi:ATP-binding protein involved in chromosome partitioning